MQRWEYSTVEWIWAAGELRITLPGRDEILRRGSYVEVVATLCELGKDCWEVAGKVAAGDWVYWTVKRPLE